MAETIISLMKIKGSVFPINLNPLILVHVLATQQKASLSNAGGASAIIMKIQQITLRLFHLLVTSLVVHASLEYVVEYPEPGRRVAARNAAFERRQRSQVGARDVTELEKRACNADNVLRALQANSASASPFCVSFNHIPTATVTVTPATAHPVVKTTTVTFTRTIYPGGRALESITLPYYVQTFPASRVSSGCSCLSVTPSPVTVSTNLPTITSTTTATATKTLSGYCATATPYVGAGSLGTGQQGQGIENPPGINNAYDCCVKCQTGFPQYNCVVWIAGAGYCDILNEIPTSGGSTCAVSGETANVGISAGYDGLGGTGPCAGQINVYNQ
ncbi:MAG: hypothetical protein M1812_007661 [Candelaria pacifica]|nr:MAG: hypothetical protein M1812_007661 [Candelaria pacifica]